MVVAVGIDTSTVTYPGLNEVAVATELAGAFVLSGWLPVSTTVRADTG